jgi:hypothetical protein
MTIHRTLQIDALGRETQFVVVDANLTDYGRTQWEAHLTALALGYTKLHAIGGWRGIEEPITIYRVASLSAKDRQECIKFLLDARYSPAIGKLHRDLYVIHDDGQAYGYCYTYDDAAINLPTFHGMVQQSTVADVEAAKAASFIGRQSPAAQAKYRGTRDTGWLK